MWNTEEPKKKGWYVVTVLSDNGAESSCAYWTGAFWTQLEESEKTDKYLEINVIAWAELPEPYRK